MKTRIVKVGRWIWGTYLFSLEISCNSDSSPGHTWRLAMLLKFSHAENLALLAKKLMILAKWERG